MSPYLVVPMRLDALLLDHDQMVAAASADYARLPYTDGAQDSGADVANISEEILSQPFQNQDLLLRQGVHLHWALPDALTRARGDDGPAVFPSVPNRWLVLRSGDAPAKAWIVESDYLYPDGEGAAQGGVSVPFTPNPAAGRHRPFRYLGRSMPLELWPGELVPAERVGRVTAVGFEQADGSGYGEPTFAAFYPNCRSVFGFYDADFASAPPPASLQYDVIGWYSRADQDYLAGFRARVLRQAQPGAPPPSAAELRKALEQDAHWLLEAGDLPDRMLCHARLICRRDAAPPAPSTTPHTSITVGNTAVEALSAFLGQQIDASNRALIEDQLEALHLLPRLEHRQLDVGAKFREARHERGFQAIPGGSLWTVRLEHAEGDANAEQAQARESLDLRDELAGTLLIALNQTQREYDAALIEIDTLRAQLFSDWYKYMLCAYPPEDTRDAYPDVDEARHYVRTRSLEPLRRLDAATTGTQADTLERHITAALAQLHARLAVLNQGEAMQKAKSSYVVKRIAAPRYWQPRDPVVLISGPDIEPTARHGQDGDLICKLAPLETPAALVVAARSNPAQLLAGFQPAPHPNGVGVNEWAAPWHPFLLEWEAQLYPLRNLGNIAPATLDYADTFVTANYRLPPDQPDFVLPGGAGALAQVAMVYRGASILTQHADDLLEARLADYLRSELLDDFYKAQNIPADQRDLAFLPVQIDALQQWYAAGHAALATPEGRARDPLFTAMRAYRALQSDTTLAQALGGFHQALLQHRQVRQLGVADPLGFGEARAFSDEVGKAVGLFTRSAPDPLSDFSPIRSGALKLLRLRLIDTFGQLRDLPLDRVSAAESLLFAGSPDLIAMPPRLVQPARLDLRWLAAAHPNQEMVDHPDAAPICGWLVPNFLDNQLLVYDPAGHALGALDAQGAWLPAPGAPAADLASLNLPHLTRMVTFLRGQDSGLMSSMLDAIEQALEVIEPETSQQHPELTLLMGRPLALVRAALDLQLRGTPAVNQGWASFQQDLTRNNRDHDNFPRVRFPVYLGDVGQLNDGLVGYWVEDQRGDYADGLFYAPQSYQGGSAQIVVANDPRARLLCGVEDPPVTLCMLLDPRGVVHARSGIQPVKAIGLPPEQYVDALRAIEVTFLAAPILTGTRTIDLPLPSELGYAWSWLEHDGEQWTELFSAPTLARDDFRQALAGRLWDALLDSRVGWLAPAAGDTALVRAADAPGRAATLAAPFAGWQAAAQTLLAEFGAGPVPRARFIGRAAEALGEPAWASLHRDDVGWLAPLPGRPEQALIVPQDQRKQAVLAGSLAGAEPLLEQIFDLHRQQIGTPSTRATFADPPELREGWVKLRAG